MERYSKVSKMLIEGKMCEARMEYPAPKTESETFLQNTSQPAGSRYVRMAYAKNYAEGMEALRKELEARPTVHPTFVLPDEKVVYRSLTFKETIRARVENYETLHNEDGSERTLEERLSLMESWNDTCTAIAYKAGTTKFKIIPQSSDLITITTDFKEEFMKRDFDSLPGTVLDSRERWYIDRLTKDGALKNPAWIAAVEEDLSLLTAYANIVFAQLKKDGKREGMDFYVFQRMEADELCALFIYGHGSEFSAGGNGYLNCGGSFIRVARSDGK